jgi:pyridoxine 5-phosphate synthase
VPVVELHTGPYAHGGAGELVRLQLAAAHAAALGLEVHAGHGLTTANVGPVATIPGLAELNIGHYIVGEAVFIGLDAAVRAMRLAMDEGLRAGTRGIEKP